MKKMISVLGVIAFLSIACTRRADQIEPADISYIGYESLTCKELKEEFIKVNKGLAVASTQQDSLVEKNAFGMTMLAVGILLIPSGDQKVTIKLLKGEYKAIKEVATKKNCSFVADMMPLPLAKKII